MSRWFRAAAALSLIMAVLIGIAVALGHHMRGSGVVIYVQEWNEPGLVAVDLDRAARQWFTRNFSYAGRASFACSSDGRQIALFSEETRFLFHLFVIDLDTHRITRVNVPDLQDSLPSWTPDSLHLVVAAGPDDENTDLYLVDLTGESREQLTDLPGQEFQPSVSSRGDLLFSHRSLGASLVDLMVLDWETRSLTTLASTEYSGARTARWSPDGMQIAFARKVNPQENTSPYDMMVVAPDENRLRTLIDSLIHTIGGVPIWMPDSRHLITLGADGVFFADTVTGQLDISPHWIMSGGSGVLTATADRILTVVQMKYGNLTYIVRIDGTEQQQLPISLFATLTSIALAPSW